MSGDNRQLAGGPEPVQYASGGGVAPDLVRRSWTRDADAGITDVEKGWCITALGIGADTLCGCGAVTVDVVVAVTVVIAAVVVLVAAVLAVTAVVEVVVSCIIDGACLVGLLLYAL